jgi:hypothetical protein
VPQFRTPDAIAGTSAMAAQRSSLTAVTLLVLAGAIAS